MRGITVRVSFFLLILLNLGFTGQLRHVKTLLWENPDAVIIEGKYLYCADGEGLYILEWKDSTSFEIVGQARDNSNFEYFAYNSGFQIVGDRAYLGKHDAGISIFDVSDRQNPFFILNYPGSFYKMLVDGQNAYTAEKKEDHYLRGVTESCLKVLDFSNYNEIKITDEYEVDGAIDDISLNENVLYLAVNKRTGYESGAGKLQMLDVSDRHDIQYLGEYNADEMINSIMVNQSYAYLLISNIGIQVLDVKNRRMPEFVAERQCPDACYDKKMILYDNMIYLSPCDEQFFVFDVSNPRDIKLVESVSPDIYGNIISNPGDIFAIHTYWKPRDNSATIYLLDIQDPQHIKPVGEYGSDHHLLDVAFSGNYAFITEHDRGLSVVDISKKPGKEFVGFWDYKESVHNIMMDDNFAFISVLLDDNLLIDISNPTKPRITAKFDENLYINYVLFYKELMLAGRYGHIIVYDISDPDAPDTLFSIKATFGVDYMQIKGNYLYLSTGGFQVYDITDIENARFLSSYNLYSKRFRVRGNYAYVAAGRDGMEILDISDPEHIKSVSKFQVDRTDADGKLPFMNDIALLGDHAFLISTLDLKGVYAVNISDPGSPYLEDEFGGMYSAEYIYEHNGLIYIPEMNGLIILEFEE